MSKNFDVNRFIGNNDHKYMAIDRYFSNLYPTESAKLGNFCPIIWHARWFHPSDEAQEIDWDKFAVLGVQKVENVKSTVELRDTLYRLFSPIVQGLQIYEVRKPEIFNPDILLSPDPDAKPIAWQHHGVYLNEQSNIYKSIRTNKCGVDKKVDGAIIYKYSLHSSHLAGKEVKISGYFKSNKRGAKLFIQPVESWSNYKRQEAFIEESQDWRRVELLLKMPQETFGIIYGLEIEGDADVCADDFEFIVYSEGEWIPVDTENMGFERGKSDDKSIPVYDWMSSAMLHTFEVFDENTHSGKYCLKVKYAGKMFEYLPQFGEVTKKFIGNSLICVVPLTLLSNESSTFPKSEISSLNHLKSEISKIRISKEFNSHVNLASVIIAWNVLQHFFPYFDVIDVDWNEALNETLKRTFTNNRKKDFFVTLRQMIAKLNDGHGVVSGEQIYPLPIKTEFIEKEIVITASNDSALKRGDIIKKIDGKAVMEALKEKEKILSGSPQLRRYRALNILGSKFNPDEKIRLKIVQDGKPLNLTVESIGIGKSFFFNPIEGRQYLNDDIIEIEPGIYYINMANCTEIEFEQNIDLLAKAKVVIYDQRDGIKLNFFQIVPYWIEEPVYSTW